MRQGRPPKKKIMLRNSRMVYYVSEREAKRILRKANMLGVSHSDFARVAVMKEVKK